MKNKKKEYSTRTPGLYKSPITQYLEAQEENAQMEIDFPDIEESVRL